MQTFLIFILGIVVGMVVVWVWMWVKSRQKKESLIERQRREKEADKERILGLMESGNQPLSNEHVRMMIDIPESTATRYFEELEREGKVRQGGTTGQAVYYELVQ